MTLVGQHSTGKACPSLLDHICPIFEVRKSDIIISHTAAIYASAHLETGDSLSIYNMPATQK